MPTQRPRNATEQSAPKTPKRATQSSIATFLRTAVGPPESPSRQKPARKKRAGGDNRVQITPDVRNSKIPPTPLRRKNSRTPENDQKKPSEAEDVHMEKNKQQNVTETNQKDRKNTKKISKNEKKPKKEQKETNRKSEKDDEELPDGNEGYSEDEFEEASQGNEDYYETDNELEEDVGADYEEEEEIEEDEEEEYYEDETEITEDKDSEEADAQIYENEEKEELEYYSDEDVAESEEYGENEDLYQHDEDEDNLSVQEEDYEEEEEQDDGYDEANFTHSDEGSQQSHSMTQSDSHDDTEESKVYSDQKEGSGGESEIDNRKTVRNKRNRKKTKKGGVENHMVEKRKNKGKEKQEKGRPVVRRNLRSSKTPKSTEVLDQVTTKTAKVQGEKHDKIRKPKSSKTSTTQKKPAKKSQPKPQPAATIPDQMDIDEAAQVSYVEATQQEIDDDDKTVDAANDRWIARRVRIKVTIAEPKDKEQRLKFLQSGINKMLKAGRNFEPDLYIRKFEENDRPLEKEKKSWKQRFRSSDNSATNFVDYFQGGLKGWTKVEQTVFYFRVTLVVPPLCDIPRLLAEIEMLAPTGCSINDILCQKIYKPMKIGHLLRSHQKMTSSDDFINEINRRAQQLNPKVWFGISYGAMNLPSGEKVQYSKAAKAVILECNADELREATDIALLLFPGKRVRGHKKVWGMRLVFVYDTKHPDVNNLDTAQSNIDTLITRQKTHSKYEMFASNKSLKPGALEKRLNPLSTKTLRDVVMSIKATTTPGCEGGTLFSSIMFSTYQGNREHIFTFHTKVKREAEAVCRALPVMLKDEYNIPPEEYFWDSSIDKSDLWNKDTRQLRNAITRATDTMLEGTDDLIDDDATDEEDLENVIPITEEAGLELDSVASRERRRCMGQDEDETVINQKKPKKKRQQASSNTPQAYIDISDINSVETNSVGMGSVSGHSKTREAQQEVLVEAGTMIQGAEARLQEANAALTKKVEEMARLMAQAGIASPAGKEVQKDDSTLGKQSSGEGSGSNQQDIPPPNLDGNQFQALAAEDSESDNSRIGIHGEDFDFNRGADEDAAISDAERKK